MAHSGRTGPSAQWMKKAFASTEKLQEIADKNSLFDGANRGSDYVAPPEESPSADTKDTATYENAARAESSQPDRNHWLETFVILLAGILTVGILLLLISLSQSANKVTPTWKSDSTTWSDAQLKAFAISHGLTESWNELSEGASTETKLANLRKAAGRKLYRKQKNRENARMALKITGKTLIGGGLADALVVVGHTLPFVYPGTLINTTIGMVIANATEQQIPMFDKEGNVICAENGDPILWKSVDHAIEQRFKQETRNAGSQFMENVRLQFMDLPLSRIEEVDAQQRD